MSQQATNVSGVVTIVSCLKVTLDLARQGVLDDREPSLAEEVARQQEACSRVEALLNNHASDLILMSEPYGRNGGLGYPIRDSDGLTREIDLDDIRGISKDARNDAMAICFELACQQIRRREDETAGITVIDGARVDIDDAINLAGTFWEFHHDDIRQLEHALLDVTAPSNQPGPEL